MNDKPLALALSQWRSWAEFADRREDGWQALFPEWNTLMSAASATMEKPSLTESEFGDIEFCWVISEEDETLADYAKANSEKCWPVVQKLVTSRYPEVRWQTYDVLGCAGKKGEPLLRICLRDQDPYCRRRALLALAQIRPDDGVKLAANFENDSDPYVRQAAKTLKDSLL